MTELIDECDGNTLVLHDVIDDKYEKIRKLNDYLDFLRNKQPGWLAKSLRINEFEISLTGELKLLCDTKAALNSEIETISKLVDEKQEEVEKIELAKKVSEDERLEKIISYEKTSTEGLTRFHDALRIYNEEYLSKEIEEIRNEGRKIKEKIQILDKTIEALVSKHKLNEIENIETSGKELAKLKQIWSNANWDRVSARKLREYLNKELEEKVGLNERKIARFI